MNEILVPQKPLKGKIFEALECKGVEKVLQKCIAENHSPVFMPQLIDARIEALKNGNLTTWNLWFVTQSICATGRTKGGKAVVAYGHVQNYLSNPENIATAKIVNGAAILPKQEFYRLLEMEDDKNVYVVDYNKLKNSPQGLIPVTRALEHPQTIPGLGGRQRVEEYLPAHEKAYQRNLMGMYYYDDIGDKPTGRLLLLDNDYSGLYSTLGSYGRVLGVENSTTAKATHEKTTLSLDEIIADLKHLVAPANEEAVRKVLGKYNQ